MKKEKIIERFNEVASAPYTYLKKLKEDTGKKMIGSTCVFTPEEIILAAGAHPFRISGQSYNLSNADAHLQAYSCSMVRSMLEDGFSDDLDFADGVVFPHTCDSIQRLSDIWRLNLKTLHFDVLLPVKLDSPLSKEYFVKVLERFAGDIEKALNVEITESDLREAIILMNETRRLLEKIYNLRSQNPAIIMGSEMSAIVKSSMVMEKREFVKLLDELIQIIENTEYKSGNVKRILISGSICSHPDIYKIVENKGAAVVWDDLCSGSRYFEGLVNENDEPYRAIAERFTERYVCPAKHLGVDFQIKNLKKIIEMHKIDGILFMLLKFCEPFAFDYPDIKKELEDMEIPFLLVEMDRHNEVDEQMRTRIDTILEIL